jgi:amidase
VSDEIWWRPIRELAAMVRDRQVSVTELVMHHLRRVDATNPTVNAIVTTDPERSLREAAAADAAVARGDRIGPLHGLPAAFKDTHDTEGMRTTYGSPIFADHVPTADALVVERIRGAGAITIGKTNAPEFGAGSHTFNQVFGLTRNPYALDRSAGGSSGGAAAALATGMVAVADGGDMGGSLRNPAAFCNVVGLRPTPGRVPEATDQFGWQTLAVTGPMGRTVDDVAVLLSVISGPDPRSPIALDDDGTEFADIRPADPRGLRVAWSADFGGTVDVDTDVLDVLAPHRTTLTDLGCHVDEACIDLSGADEAFRTLRAWTFAHHMADTLREHRDRLKPSLVWNIEQGQQLTGQDVARAVETLTVLYRRAHEFFQHHDLLVLPTTQVTPFPADLEYPTEVAGHPQSTYLDWMRSAYAVTMTGCPALSLPAGFTPAGLPVGIQFVTRQRTESRLLSIAKTFEQATGFHHRHPDTDAWPATGRQV